MKDSKIYISEFVAISVIILSFILLLTPIYIFVSEFTLETMLSLILVIILSDILITSLSLWWKYRNKHLDENELGILDDYTDSLSDSFESCNPRFVVLDIDVPNAYATDLLPTRPIVVLTKGLFDELSNSEMEAVVAHELSHINSYDVFLMTTLSAFTSKIRNTYQKSKISAFTSNNTLDKIFWGSIFIVLWVSLFITHASLYYLSRIREYKADEDAAEATSPRTMIRALQKIDSRIKEKSEEETLKLSGQEALCISSLGTFGDGLFDTHPPMDERIERLEEMKKD